MLIVRALIPAGFMLMAGTDGLALMFCSGSMQTTSPHARHAGYADGHAGHDAAMHATHAHVDHGTTNQEPNSADRSADNAPCPFAIAACAATVDVPYLHVPGAAPIDEPFVAVTPSVSDFDAEYANSIRGPPRVC